MSGEEMKIGYADKIGIKIELSILKPAKEVFEAVLNPAPFFVESSSGPLREGAEVTWKFAGVKEGFPVRVRKVEPGKRIVLEWASQEGGHDNTVEFSFKPLQEDVTTVSISESGWEETEKGRELSYQNCQGWMHMACSLKSFLEYGINLRKGSFLHMGMG